MTRLEINSWYSWYSICGSCN